MKKKIYILSGLGADERVFQCLDLSDYKVHFIKWIPVYPKETIEQYATRLLLQIEERCPVLIGLSFGGIMAIEIAKKIETDSVIIIASAKTKNEIPFYYQFIGKLNLHKLIPSTILTKSNKITNYLFGANSFFEKDLLKQVLSDTDPSFMKWAIDKIVKWQNIDLLSNLCHIHGTKDRILPIHFIQSDFNIKYGGHLMTLSNPDEIMRIVRLKLNTIDL